MLFFECTWTKYGWEDCEVSNVGDSTKDSVSKSDIGMEADPNCPPNLEKDKDYTASSVQNKFNCCTRSYQFTCTEMHALKMYSLLVHIPH